MRTGAEDGDEPRARLPHADPPAHLPRGDPRLRPSPPQEGFDALDPFVPILVPSYNPKEFESCIQYYLENDWLQHEKGG